MNNKILDQMLENEKTSKYTRGEMRLLGEYVKSRREYEQIVIADICWEQEMDDLIALLRKAEIKTFVMADHSTALLQTLHRFLEEGFTITSSVTLEKKEPTRWDEPLKGLEIQVNMD